MKVMWPINAFSLDWIHSQILKGQVENMDFRQAILTHKYNSSTSA